jgi:hypothetical protein
MKKNILSKSYFFACTIFLFLSLVCQSQESLKLVDDGKSNYEIVIKEHVADNLNSPEKTLQSYINKVTSATLPIVTNSERESTKNSVLLYVEKRIDPNQINIKVRGDDLVISAGSEISLNYAVYEFLEKYLHCKWYAPDVEVVPVSSMIKITKDTDYTYTPAITTRTVHSLLFYDNPGFAKKHRVTAESFPYYVPTAKVHTFHKFIPEEVYYESHPEYFALRGDTRLPTQLCLSNDEVYELVKDSVASLFKQYPEATVVSVSQDDNQQYCTCEFCNAIDETEGSHSGTMIQFVNKIAANFPDKTISTLAYQYTRKPPKTKALDNVLITLCSIECDRSGPIEEKCVDFANDLKGWKAITQNVRIWDYTTQFTNFLAPFPNLHTLQPNLQFFRDNNAKWVFEQHSSNPSELFELRSYITAKLLWNPDANFQELITEFTDGYYKEAGIYVRNYINLIRKEIQEDPDFFLFLYGDPSQAFSSFLKPELLTTYDSYFNDAEKVVAQKPAVLKRIKEARLSVDYAILEACKKNLAPEFSMVLVNEEGQKVINPEVINRLESFYKTCNKANITLMNEMRFTVQEYYDNYKKTMEVATQPNKAFGKKVTLLTKPRKYADEDPQILTDGALGGNSFYANWLGFEGNHLEAVIDLEAEQEISFLSTAFLQVTNHVVFFPEKVSYAYSQDGEHYSALGTITNDAPLTKTSKINEIKYFKLKFPKVKARYIKVFGENMNEPPYWHHAAGTSAWIFADEVIVD